jgi:hypothetical protein
MNHAGKQKGKWPGRAGYMVMGMNVAGRLLERTIKFVIKHAWSLLNKLQKCLNINLSVSGVCFKKTVRILVISLLKSLRCITKTCIIMTGYKKIVLYRLKILRMLK